MYVLNKIIIFIIIKGFPNLFIVAVHETPFLTSQNTWIFNFKKKAYLKPWVAQPCRETQSENFWLFRLCVYVCENACAICQVAGAMYSFWPSSFIQEWIPACPEGFKTYLMRRNHSWLWLMGYVILGWD